MKISPIALFTFKKLEPLQVTVEALKRNTLAKNSELVVFSDAAAKSGDKEAVTAVRAYLNTIEGFKKVSIVLAETNKGLANSIIDGVSQLLELHETIIVLEDDLVCSTNFLSYMNAALAFYEDNPKIHSIAGYSPPVSVPTNYLYDNYFTKRASSWGWATYRTQWDKVDWNVSDYEEFKTNGRAQKKFNLMGSDLTSMLSKQMNGKIDSWAIRWCYHQYKNDLFTVFPVYSKIENIGFTSGATHTTGKNQGSRFTTVLDTSDTLEFSFNPKISLNIRFIKDFVKPYSLSTRIYYKLKSVLNV